MERKTKQRILGVCVVAGLVVISLPFLQSGKEAPSEAMLVKAPPFPDQPVQVMANATQPATTQSTVATTVAQEVPSAATSSIKQNADPDDTIKLNAANTTPANTNVANTTPSMNETNQADQPQKQFTSGDIWSEEELQDQATQHAAPQKTNALVEPAPKTIMADPESALINKKAQTHSETSDPVAPQKTSVIKEVKTTSLTPKAVETNKRIHTTKSKASNGISPVKMAINNDGLVNLKNPAWIIQVGSFKSKANALRLVNQLRANGYKAFIQQVSNSTRVFVGPELKQMSARALANRLESELQIRGIVLSYKPFAL